MQTIEWKQIPYAPGYMVSEYGDLKSPTRENYKPSFNTKGYACIRIPRYSMCPAVHRVVAKLWLGPNPGGLQVNHKDGNKLNNHYSNLEYITCRDNIHHAIRNGLRTSTINLKDNRMFDEIQVKTIKHLFNDGLTNQHISEYFKCHHSTISKIRRGHNYPNVSI